MRQKIVADRQIDWHTKVNQYTHPPPSERGYIYEVWGKSLTMTIKFWYSYTTSQVFYEYYFWG